MPGTRAVVTSENLPLSLGFSPCPNDTFIFHALVHGMVKAEGLSFCERLEDVETLNMLALSGSLDITKTSFHLYGHLRDSYTLLASGSALGRGCGPLLISQKPCTPEMLRGKPIALPGRYTTATLLLRLFDPALDNFLFMPFSEIIPAVASGKVAAGVIIHESRFTFRNQGLVQLVDLGEWWESDTGMPLPLGGIIARRSLGEEVIRRVSSAIHASIKYAFANPFASQSYIRAHSREMSDKVCKAHIDLYVNDFSLDLGEEGLNAVNTLLVRGEKAGIIPRSV